MNLFKKDKTVATGPYYRWTKAFLYARLHEMDHAVETMQDYYEYWDGAIPQKVMEKLEAVMNGHNLKCAINGSGK